MGKISTVGKPVITLPRNPIDPKALELVVLDEKKDGRLFIAQNGHGGKFVIVQRDIFVNDGSGKDRVCPIYYIKKSSADRLSADGRDELAEKNFVSCLTGKKLDDRKDYLFTGHEWQIWQENDVWLTRLWFLLGHKTDNITDVFIENNLKEQEANRKRVAEEEKARKTEQKRRQGGRTRLQMAVDEAERSIVRSEITEKLVDAELERRRKGGGK